MPRPDSLVALSLFVLQLTPSVATPAVRVNLTRKEDPWDYYPQRPIGVGWQNHTDHFRTGQIYRGASVIGLSETELLIADCFNNRLQVASMRDDKKRWAQPRRVGVAHISR